MPNAVVLVLVGCGVGCSPLFLPFLVEPVFLPCVRAISAWTSLGRHRWVGSNDFFWSNVYKIDKPRNRHIIQKARKIWFRFVYQLDVSSVISRSVLQFSNFQIYQPNKNQPTVVGGFNPILSNFQQKKRRMTPSANYSAYFQAQLQVTPPKKVQPVKDKSKVVIRYKRSWTKEQ